MGPDGRTLGHVIYMGAMGEHIRELQTGRVGGTKDCRLKNIYILSHSSHDIIIRK